MMDHTKYMVLLSKVYQKSDRLEDAILALTKAREMQARWVDFTVSYLKTLPKG